MVGVLAAALAALLLLVYLNRYRMLPYRSSWLRA
jgi:hypothetical protein